MSHRVRYSTVIILFLFTILSLTGCSAITEPLPPTPDPLVVEETVEAVKTHAAETVIAELTQNAPLPTETVEPSPTMPPTEEPTPIPPTSTATSAPIVLPTATFIPLPTQTPTPSALACSIVSQSPASGANLKVKTDFDLVVKVKNTGTKDWDKHVVDFFYVSGTKFQSYVDIIDFPDHVPAGKEITLIIDMTAPDKAGTYTAVWAVGEGSTRYCLVNINVSVTE